MVMKSLTEVMNGRLCACGRVGCGDGAIDPKRRRIDYESEVKGSRDQIFLGISFGNKVPGLQGRTAHVFCTTTGLKPHSYALTSEHRRRTGECVQPFE
jgi:hypothetical protein